MADKNSVADWSTTASSNDNVGGVPLGENVMLPSNVNNAFRVMMSQIKTLYNTLINAVLFTAQTITAAQQGQARANIGADLLAGHRNKAINGDLDVWERGTSATGVTAALSYGPDRWLFATSGATISWSRQTHVLGQVTVPGNPKYFGRLSATVANDNVALSNTIPDVRTHAGEKVTVTIYLKSPASAPTGLSARLIQNFGTGGSPSGDVTTTLGSGLSITSGFVKFQWVVDVPSISGKTLGTNNDDYLRFTLINTANETFTLDWSHLSIVPGDASAETNPFAPRPVQQEEELCRFFYRKSYPRGVAPGTASTAAGAVYLAANGTSVYGRTTLVTLGSPMRTTPTVVFYSRETGATGKLYDLTGGTDDDASSPAISTSSFMGGWTNAADTADGNNGGFHWTADADYY